jgi:hypothetical protein
MNGQKPNILLIMVDQQRYPPIYENEEIRSWRKKYLQAQNILRKSGFEKRSLQASFLFKTYAIKGPTFLFLQLLESVP